MWNVEHITTGLSLVAFVGLLIFVAYRAYLKHRLKTINTCDRQQRADLITKELNAFGIQAKKLSREQQYNLAIKELDLRAHRSSIGAVTTGVAILIFGGMTALAIVFNTQIVSSTPTAPSSNRFSQTQIINTLSPHNGGKDTLNLDNVATLSRGPEWSIDRISLFLNTVFITLPNSHPDSISIEGRRFAPSAGKLYYFDVANNKQQDISTGGPYLL